MTAAETWLDRLHNISDRAPHDLDALLAPEPHAARPPVPGFPAVSGRTAPSSRIWSRPDDGSSYIGIRVTAPLADIAPLAWRLAAVAVERRVIPIILTTIAPSGFERFGFRAERLYGASDTERAAVEAELIAFWNIAIVIDAADVAYLT